MTELIALIIFVGCLSSLMYIIIDVVYFMLEA